MTCLSIYNDDDIALINTSNDLPIYLGGQTCSIALNRFRRWPGPEGDLMIDAAIQDMKYLINNRVGIPEEELYFSFIEGNRFILQFKSKEYYTLFLLAYAGKGT